MRKEDLFNICYKIKFTIIEKMRINIHTLYKSNNNNKFGIIQTQKPQKFVAFC